ncbi:MAG: hypothetical protein PHU31_02600, partial [Anaerotignum sp.]|nr:hypothetical protein [Anaerotignum sp.]
MMNNKIKYQKTFSRLTTSEDTIQEVLKMDQNKKYRHIKKSTAVIAASLLLIGTTGVAYAATDGNISMLWDKITFTIDGKEVDLGDFVKTDEDGTSYLSYEDEGVSYSISADPSTIPENWDCNLDINTSTSSSEGTVAFSSAGTVEDEKDSLGSSEFSSEITIVEYPFTLVPEGDKLYLLVSETSEKIDITKAAASKEGYPYTWTTAQGTSITAIVFGTPEAHSIQL